jgi:hypothetical protein
VDGESCNCKHEHDPDEENERVHGDESHNVMGQQPRLGIREL